MPFVRPIAALRRWTARLPPYAPYGMAAVFVAAGLGVRYLAEHLDWPGPTAMLFLVYSIAAAAMLRPAAGYFATVLAALASLPFMPTTPGGWLRPDWILPLVIFIMLGSGITGLLASLTRAIGERDAALRRRALLLVEYRHRSRGDLQAISSLLRLRARHVTDPAAKAALAEAAGHTVALGRIHTRLERARVDTDETATVDAGDFVRGMCADLVPPVPDAWGASRPLSTERAVSLGLLICELVAEARRDGAARIIVRLSIVGPSFVLDLIDDRPDVGETDGMRVRLIGLLAGQLRGGIVHLPNEAGPGWATTCRFPILAPVLAPGHVGSG